LRNGGSHFVLVGFTPQELPLAVRLTEKLSGLRNFSSTTAPPFTASTRERTMLSWPYAHLLINHFPVVLSISALAVAILALLLPRRGLWLTAMGALTAAGASVYPVFYTGGAADHALGDPWYIHPGTIEAHDSAAGIALFVILIAGLFAAYSWRRSLKRPADLIPRWMRAGVVVGSLAAVGTVTYTAYLGGKIIHEAPVLEMNQRPAGLPPGIAAPPAKD